MRTLEMVLLYGATGLGWVFILLYAVLAPWSRYWAGRHMMVGSVVITLVLTFLLFRSTGTIGDMSPAWRHTVTVTIYGMLALLMGWRVYLLLWIQVIKRKRRERHGEPVRD